MELIAQITKKCLVVPNHEFCLPAARVVKYANHNEVEMDHDNANKNEIDALEFILAGLDGVTHPPRVTRGSLW